jgi:hypothetical protein
MRCGITSSTLPLSLALDMRIANISTTMLDSIGIVGLLV